MPDVTAVDWLPLDAAVERLSRDHERAFLASVGPLALESARRSRDRKPAVIEKPAAEKPRRRRVVAPKATPASPTPVPSAPLAPLPAPPAPVAPCADETVPIIEFAPRAVEHDALGESSAAAIAPVLEEARAPAADAIAPDAARLRDDRTAAEQSVSHVTMMRRMRNWLRRAS
jgi:8-oxo-dGTP diphosphatase